MSETKEIALVERESVNGKLVTNIDELETFVAERLVEYTPENYKGDADAAKKDRATLNTSKKTVSAKRIDIIKRAMERFGIDTFETRCKKVEKDIDAAALALDAIVKTREEEEKAVKLAQIREFWKVQNFDLVPLEKVFDQKWLNKTTKNKDVFEEIEAKIASIYEGIKTIEAFGVDVDTLKPIYLETLDIGATIQQGNRLRENRERLVREETERKEREEARAKREAQESLDRETIDAQKNEAPASLAAQASGDVPDPDPVDEFVCRFKGRRSKLFALRQFMLDNGITHEKVEDK